MPANPQENETSAKKKPRKPAQAVSSPELEALLASTESSELKVLIRAVDKIQESVDVISDDVRMAAISRNGGADNLAKLLRECAVEMRQLGSAVREQTQLNRDSLAIVAICDRLTASQARELRKVAAKYLAETKAKPEGKPQPIWLVCTIWTVGCLVVCLAMFGAYALLR